MKIKMFKAAIPEIEGVLGYTFRDKGLLTQAFTRTSFCNESQGGYQSNEVLEFFGDGVLSVAIISHLLEKMAERYEHGIKTRLGEGDFSNIKSKLSDKKNLSESMRALGLAKFLIMGEGDAKMQIEKEPSVLEDLFESIIGAIYIDCDMNIRVLMRVVDRMLDLSAYTNSAPPIQSAKNALQEWCDHKKRRLPHPIYETVSESGPDHKKIYERSVRIGDRVVATGSGKNTKIADAEAASAALMILMEEEAAALASQVPSTEKTSASEPAKKPARGTTSAKKPLQDEKKRATPAPVSKKTAAEAKTATEPTKGGKGGVTPSPVSKKATAEAKTATEPAKGGKGGITPSSVSKKTATEAKTATEPAKGEKGGITPSPVSKKATAEAKTATEPTKGGKGSATPAPVSKKAAPTRKSKVESRANVEGEKTAKAAPTKEATKPHYTAKLKIYAKSKGLPSPIFKLLSEGAGGICRIECKLGGDTAIGCGGSLSLAREDAAEKLLSSVKRRSTLACLNKTPASNTASKSKRAKKK